MQEHTYFVHFVQERCQRFIVGHHAHKSVLVGDN